LNIIQTIYKTEKLNGLLERLNIAGSKGFIEYLTKNNYISIYNMVGMSEPDSKQFEYLSKQKTITESLYAYNERLFNSIANKEDIGQLPELKIVYDDIHIHLFEKQNTNEAPQNLTQIDQDDINLTSFLSNINFVDHLCNICEDIGQIRVDLQHAALMEHIKKINSLLPANIYLPFLKDSIRYYVIANIPISEVKIFKTKNRAPYMITIEAFRLEELNR
jgi:hypothetical protein